MQLCGFACLLICSVGLLCGGSAIAQNSPPAQPVPKHVDGPTSPKAQKAYQEGIALMNKRNFVFAVGKFKKADKEDDGRCPACQANIRRCSIEIRDWKDAEAASEELLSEAQGNTALAIAHYNLGAVLLQEGLEKRRDKNFTEAHDELSKALAISSSFPQALFADGEVLAHLKQDEAAKARFESFLTSGQPNDLDRRRAQLFIKEPELARARMAPPFSVTTSDGKRISLDDLHGKVVLLDFWATWCGPCQEALPHMREIAKRFQGQPLVILSVSLDDNEQKWKDFIAKNGMTWLQYRDGGFEGPISHLFGVDAIPHTFTIDSDGVLQDEHIGDAAIEGKLKKLCARAEQEQSPQTAAK